VNTLHRLFLTTGLLSFVAGAGAQEQQTIPLEAALKDRCISILRAGLASDEFWPAMHAAEALSLAGERAEVLTALANRKADDDQQACGLAREAVRAGDRSQISVLLDILTKVGSNGHTHAAESLFKVCEVGTGDGLRAAGREKRRQI
jgi:sialidase-1